MVCSSGVEVSQWQMQLWRSLFGPETSTMIIWAGIENQGTQWVNKSSCTLELFHNFRLMCLEPILHAPSYDEEVVRPGLPWKWGGNNGCYNQAWSWSRRSQRPPFSTLVWLTWVTYWPSCTWHGLGIPGHKIHLHKYTKHKYKYEWSDSLEAHIGGAPGPAWKSQVTRYNGWLGGFGCIRSWMITFQNTCWWNGFSAREVTEWWVEVIQEIAKSTPTVLGRMNRKWALQRFLFSWLFTTSTQCEITNSPHLLSTDGFKV